MDRNAAEPPYRLGRAIFEGVGISSSANRITYAMNGNHDPNLDGPNEHEVHVTEIVYLDCSGSALMGQIRLIE